MMARRSGLAAEEAVADGVAGGVERLVEVGEEVALLGGAGLGGVGGEVWGHGVEEQVAHRHGRPEGALHHAGVAEVFEAGGGSGAGSGLGSGKWDAVRMPAHGFLPSMRLISRSKSEM